jgi:hypothetical protein
MPLPDLKALRNQLIRMSSDVRLNDTPPTLKFDNQLKNTFPNWKFKDGSIDVMSPDGRAIVFPYDWLLLAAAAVPFYNALRTYKDMALQAARGDSALVEKARSDKSLNQDFRDSILKVVHSNVTDAQKLEEFLTDYTSWGGAKCIARTQDDFHWSPILDALGLLASSSGYVVDLCEKLAALQELPPSLIPTNIQQSIKIPPENLAERFSNALTNCGFQKAKNSRE